VTTTLSPARTFLLLLILSAGSSLFLTEAVVAASPQLTVIVPRGCQRGADHELTFEGARLADAQEIFFYDSGFEVLSLEATDNAVKVRVRVAADCRLGEHVAQVRSASGISEYRTLFVGPYPAVAEIEPNSLFEQPQPIDMNVTVEGIIENEDVDYFRIEAKQGDRISVEVEGMRLGVVLFDPHIAILDERRFELASADDSPLTYQDAALSIMAPEDGHYMIAVRDSSFGGTGNSRYRLHVGNFPISTAVYPAGGKLAEPTDVTFLGDPSGAISQTIELPGTARSQLALHAEDAMGIAPTGIPFRLFEHGNAFEQEPNDTFATATPAELPLAFNGIIEQDGDVDFFRFSARKGEVFEIECYARRLRSPLDPVMNLYHGNGRGIAGNDDSRGPDSYLRFEVPEDGEYILRITDHLSRGGPDFVYRVEFQSIAPTLQLSIPRVAQYSQYRQTVYVPRGGRFGTLINAARANFSGELVIENIEFPAGLTMVTTSMPANMTQMPVVWEAAEDAPLSGRLVDFTARHVDESTGIRGVFSNRADMIVGPPGQSIYWTTDVEKLAVAVVDRLPFSLEVVEPQVPLVRNGSMALKVLVHRDEGFTAPIEVQFPFRPPGLGAGSSVTIPEGTNEALYPLNAAANAALGTWKVFALGSADVGGTAWSSSQLAELEVAERPVTFAMERAASEQGQTTQILARLTVDRTFPGKARAQLLGLPAKVTSEPLEFTADTEELIFQVVTASDSPAGQHKNILCQVAIEQNGELITLTAGTTELQIDKPLPAPATPTPTPSPAAVPVGEASAPKAKPLSRLEKLRKAAADRKAQQDGSDAASGDSN
jgi:hypothetical protein